MGARDRSGLRGWRRATLVGIKTVHTAAFFSIGSCLAFFAYSSLAKRSDRRAAIAGAVVSGETIVYALNSFRCPLTSLAERLGSEHGSVADIYLPPWIEDHLPYVTGPIFAGAVVLHARNILRSREHSTTCRRSRRGCPRKDAEVSVGTRFGDAIPLDDPVERGA